MSKLLMNLFALVVIVGMQILVLMLGWGLEPKNWWWIIGVGVFANLIIHMSLAMANKE